MGTLYNYEQVEAICMFIEKGCLEPRLGVYIKESLEAYPEDIKQINRDAELLSHYLHYGLPMDWQYGDTMEALELYVDWFKCVYMDKMKDNVREQFVAYKIWLADVVEGLL